MPFNLRNAGATYPRVMNCFFYDMIGKLIEVYIDDIVVKSESKTDHSAELKLAFERMRKDSLKMNPLKYAFRVLTENFLGFLMHQKGIEVYQNKTKAIIEIPAPKTKKELQSPLDKVNYLRWFISNLARRVGGSVLCFGWEIGMNSYRRKNIREHSTIWRNIWRSPQCWFPFDMIGQWNCTFRLLRKTWDACWPKIMNRMTNNPSIILAYGWWTPKKDIRRWKSCV